MGMTDAGFQSLVTTELRRMLEVARRAPRPA